MHFDYFPDHQFASFTGVQTMIDDVRNAMSARMEQFVAQFDTRLKIRTEVNGVYLVTAVKDMTSEQGFDLVVIGTTGSSGIAEVLVGSNTEKIVRSANCPVISVPAKASLNQIKRILVPLDIREIKHGFLEQVAFLRNQLNAHLEFLWVKTPHNIENEEKVSEEIGQVIRGHQITDFDFTIIKNVFPSDGILSHAENSNADMIAMPTHARRGISHWLSGSLTEDTVNHIKIPVWSFKLDKKEKAVNLESVNKVHGKAEYKKIHLLTSD